jgi:hypothetical protein
MSKMKMRVDEEDMIEYNLNVFVEDIGEIFIQKTRDIYGHEGSCSELDCC